jgi:hypothetical protein
MNFRLLLLLIGIAGFLHHGHCSTNITLSASGGSSSSLSVRTGQTARIVFAYLQEATFNQLSVSVGGNQFSLPVLGNEATVKLPIVVVGPGTITLAGGGTGYRGFCTIEVSSADDSFVPSNAVVIPIDSGGPVNIILESSADLVTWTAALPGTYGANVTNRFFRVRAQRTQ